MSTTTDKTTAPVDLDAPTSSGGRCTYHSAEEQENTMVIEPAELGVDANGYFTGDMYERLKKMSEVMASDPGMSSADFPYDVDGMRAYVGSIIELRLLEGLSEHDANTVCMFSVLDFICGVSKMAWRIGDWLSDKPSMDRRSDDLFAVAHALASILHMTLGAFVGVPYPGDDDSSESEKPC